MIILNNQSSSILQVWFKNRRAKYRKNQRFHSPPKPPTDNHPDMSPTSHRHAEMTLTQIAVNTAQIGDKTAGMYHSSYSPPQQPRQQPQHQPRITSPTKEMDYYNSNHYRSSTSPKTPIWSPFVKEDTDRGNPGRPRCDFYERSSSYCVPTYHQQTAKSPTSPHHHDRLYYAKLAKV